MASEDFRIIWMLSLALTLTITPLHADPEWAWVGAVQPDTAVIKVGWSSTPKELEISTEADLSRAGRFQPEAKPAGPLGTLATYQATHMTPDTLYHYGFNGEVFGTFRTFPVGRASFTIGLASCANTGSNHRVFDEIVSHEQLFFLHTGDLHYMDIRENDIDRFRDGYRRTFGAERQNRFFRSQAVIYMWDDHDYGPNDSDRESPSREAALASYREVVPHYPLALGDDDPEAPVAQAFTTGRVRFILSDLRSARNRKQYPDGPDKSMMGAEQLAWFKEEVLEAHKNHAMIVWMAGVPWIANEKRGGDDWGGFAHERRVISDFLVENNITNFCAVAGDAHMLAADDGSNNLYSTDGKGPGFPVFQAAALHRSGSVKGGPYSEGRFPGPGQFGLLHIDDRGHEIELKFEGRNDKGEVLLEYSFTRP